MAGTMHVRVGRLLLAGVAVAAGGIAYAAATSMTAQQAPPPAQSLPEMREFIPLPGPGGERAQSQQGECEPTILFYHEGQLYQLRPGPQDERGLPGAPPEFYRMSPYQGPRL